MLTRGFINKNYSVGYHWFSYMDQPATGRFDCENSNNGIVNITDVPYDILVSSMKKVNNLAQNKVRT